MFLLHLMNKVVSLSFFFITVCFVSLLKVVRLKSFHRRLSKSLVNFD
jgi:hypothetical protein